MAFVQVDDLDCPHCNKITMGELNMQSGEYICLRCGRKVEGGES